MQSENLRGNLVTFSGSETPMAVPASLAIRTEAESEGPLGRVL